MHLEGEAETFVPGGCFFATGQQGEQTIGEPSRHNGTNNPDDALGDAFNTAGRAHSISHSSPRSRSRAPALTPTERGSFDSHHNLDALLSAPQRFDRRREGFDGSPRNCCTGYKIEAREQPVELLHHHRQLWRRAAPTSRQWRRWRRRRRRTREWCSALPRRYSQSSTRP